MLELMGFVLGGFVLLFFLGIAFKFTWFLASLILLPLKLLFAVAGMLLTGALVLFFLPATIMAIVVLLGGLAFAALGVLCALF
ncbi:MAG: hypothetical protein KAY24_09890 [Candidatus Eisenbacteria sp.]|nr:hypothetical protein [Candidatus Eisenbacteria bacterium]